jgi:hypothetical protein
MSSYNLSPYLCYEQMNNMYNRKDVYLQLVKFIIVPAPQNN